MKVKITRLEKQLLEDIAYTDHSSDGMGFTCWVRPSYFSLPMRQVRALISTLVQKEVIGYDPEGHGLPAHISPNPTFMVEGENGSGNPFVEGRYGFKYVNLILPKRKTGDEKNDE
jgi:hypothetical protein